MSESGGAYGTQASKALIALNAGTANGMDMQTPAPAVMNKRIYLIITLGQWSAKERRVSVMFKWFKIWRMKARARKYYRQASYRAGGGGRHITRIICPKVAEAERKFDECVEWLRKNDPDFYD